MLIRPVDQIQGLPGDSWRQHQGAGWL